MNQMSTSISSNGVAATSPTIGNHRGRAASHPVEATGPAAACIDAGRLSPGVGEDGSYRWWTRIDLREERGSGVVEWLGIAALSVAMLVGIFAGMEQVASGVIDMIRASLGVG